MDPYKVLEVPYNFNIEELKENYKRISQLVHPNNGGSQALYDEVGNCCKVLLQEYTNRKNKKQTQQKQKYQVTNNSRTSFDNNKKKSYNNKYTSNSSKFDVEKFNKLFEENRLKTVYDSGYDNWDDNDMLEQPKLKSFTLDKFNQAFDSINLNKNHKFIKKYDEPSALNAAKNINFTELGQDFDFDADLDFSGENLSTKNLNFMDYKVAHTTSRIIDPNINMRQNFRNVDDLERSRANVSYVMEEDIARNYHRNQQLENEKEARRKALCTKEFEDLDKHHQRVKELFSKQKMF